MTPVTPGPGPGADEPPPFRYSAAMAQRIERAWQDRWEREGTFHAPNPVGALRDGFERLRQRPKCFVNDMFPYPSGDRLHVGHPLGYIGSDAYGRYQRMTGHNVLHTMGFDAFGLPAEQYAIETGQHPRVTIERNIQAFRRQLRRLGLAHDPRRGVATTDPSFYRWTQWIFLQIFDAWYDRDAGRARPVRELVAELDAGAREPAAGSNPFGRGWAELDGTQRRQVVDNHRLAYRAEAPVNWCPGLGTVLANEEVTAEGRSERGNFPVFRRVLRQWMLRITAYADRLVDDLDRLAWPESVKQLQRNWIGRSEGARLSFPSPAGDVAVFTTRPDTVFGATFLALAPEHPLAGALTTAAWPDGTPAAWTGGAASPAAALAAYRRAASRRSEVERQAATGAGSGVFTGSYARNPLDGTPLPVFVADYVLPHHGTGAIMAVPGQDERDWQFAERYGLPVIRTVQPPAGWEGGAYPADGRVINSGFLDGLPCAEAGRQVVAWLEAHGAGHAEVGYKLRDWLFSRQRYWGEPFPIVYDEDGLPVALPESMLPVELPEMTDFAPVAVDPDDGDSTPVPPLSRAAGWAEVRLDLGDGPKAYRRELDIMPQWAGSCWYEIRYVDPGNAERFADPDNERYWMGPRSPGDTGGVDLYVGGVEQAVLHLLYARFWQKVLHDLGHVSADEPFRRLFTQGYVQAHAYVDDRGAHVPAAEVQRRADGWYWHGRRVERQFGKMGKSLKNSISPDGVYDAYGADTFRVHHLATAPLEQSRPWDSRAIVGSQRLLQRVWRVVVDERSGASRVVDAPAPEETRRLLHRTVASVRAAIEALRFNSAIARITELCNHVTGAFPAGAPREVAEPLVLLLAPLAPHIAEELWRRMGHASSLAWQAFPEADPAYLHGGTITIPVQVNGRLRATVEVRRGLDPAELEAAARADRRVQAQLAGRAPRKVVVVPDRLVSFVVG